MKIDKVQDHLTHSQVQNLTALHAYSYTRKMLENSSGGASLIEGEDGEKRKEGEKKGKEMRKEWGRKKESTTEGFEPAIYRLKVESHVP